MDAVQLIDLVSVPLLVIVLLLFLLMIFSPHGTGALGLLLTIMVIAVKLGWI